ncbi:hypothetical protein FSP39_014067 [Pinctada imbricata]|uniref:Uncharacterized protein n=1 Tax=Pinctada imbricata TaxID=66713 RepID=A0AA89BZX0_PINIB|nr:hypothetical protein FSP39_014067 [Pinctada imbricata]
MDFLKHHDGMIDVKRECLTLQGIEIPLVFQGPVGCFRIVANETVTIPPRSELVFQGRTVNLSEDDISKYDLGLIEPSAKFIGSQRGLVARAVVQVNTTLPVRMVNVSDDPQRIYSGTEIAELNEVSRVISDDQKVMSSTQQMTPELQALLSETSRNLNKEQQTEVTNLLREYSSLFASKNNDLGRTSVIKHKINTGDAHPIKQPLRRIPANITKEVSTQIDEMLQKGVIEPSTSPWASNIVLVKKKDGATRICIDYRRLNAVTVKDAYPLPRIDEFLDQLAGNAWFSTLDLFTGYWQVEVEENDRPKTAFTTRKGLFQFCQMPFGLCSAPATFQRLMETVLAGKQWKICLVYLDDVIVYGKSFSQMLENLRTVFNCLLKAGLKLKPKKCTWFSKEVRYLGHVVSEQGISTDPDKISAVKNWPVPVNVKEVRSFLGLCGYYRRYIQDFAAKAKCLHKLTEKGRAFIWSEECQNAFEKLKEKLIESPILAHPDFTKPFILDTDASLDSIGGVLSQEVDGYERVIAYGSRVLTKSERRYCVTRRELLAIVFFVTQFRHYLYGRKFKIRTIHGSLKWLLRFKNPEGQLARWLEVLSTYDMDIEHRPGQQHRNADALSRIPCRQCGYDPAWEKSANVNMTTVTSTVSNDVKEDNTSQSLQKLQTEDSDIQEILKWMKEGSKPPFSKIRGLDRYMKSLWSQFDNLVVHDAILYRKKNGHMQALIPKSERRFVLESSHDSKTSGHLGIRKTHDKISQRFYWPGLKADVKDYIRGCEICAKRKGPPKDKRAPMKVVEAGFPMERIALDILGELPKTDSGNKYIVVISDYYTKWTESFAMPNMEARTVAKILVEEVISRYGVPTYIHSDQGKQFESSLFQEMCSLLGIHKTRTTPYHPQSDGMVERFNRTLATMLSAYVNERQSDWDTFIPYVMMAYRSVRHETTGFTPNRLMLGRETSTPLDLQYEMPQSIKRCPQNAWVWDLQDKMEEAHRIVRRYAGSQMVRQKRYHDQKLSWEAFSEGDSVYVYFPVKKTGQSSKFVSFWRGPYKVLKKMSNLTYEIDCGPKGKPQVIHVDRMRKRHKRCLVNDNPTSSHHTDRADEPSVSHDKPSVSRDEPSESRDEPSDSRDEQSDTRGPNERDLENDENLSAFGRKRKAPSYLSDFVCDLK